MGVRGSGEPGSRGIGPLNLFKKVTGPGVKGKDLIFPTPCGAQADGGSGSGTCESRVGSGGNRVGGPTSSERERKRRETFRTGRKSSRWGSRRGRVQRRLSSRLPGVQTVTRDLSWCKWGVDRPPEGLVGGKCLLPDSSPYFI